jgi:hypothetical protein
MTIPIAFSTFLIYFIFFNRSSPNRGRSRGDGAFVCEKKGQNRKVEKIGIKSPLKCTVGASSDLFLSFFSKRDRAVQVFLENRECISHKYYGGYNP